MKKIKKLFLISLLSFNASAYAIFCPTNFQSISLGDSTTIVENMCGLPTAKKTYDKPAEATAKTWVYYVRTNESNENTKMTVTLQNDRVANIHLDGNSTNNCNNTSVWVGAAYQQNTINIVTPCQSQNNSVNVASARVCGGLLQVGDNAQMVKYLCGAPVNASDSYNNNIATTNAQITEYFYAGNPDTTLIFENGQLMGRK